MTSAYHQQSGVGLASSAAYGDALDGSLCLTPCARGSAALSAPLCGGDDIVSWCSFR